MDGFLCLLKPPGMTSSDAVVMVRRTLPKGTKVGHMGTLDPEAAGVLPIGVGSATRLFDYVVDKDKEYRAEICFGQATDTQDAQGKVLFCAPPPSVEAVRAVLPEFTGEIKQIPSAFSAIKQGGRSLYALAREGIAVEVPARRVQIYGMDFVGESGENRYMLDIRCGRGTYVRTLCHDIGLRLGSAAHMSCLLRTKTGVFALHDAVTPEEYLAAMESGTSLLRPLDEPLAYMPRVTLPRSLARVVENGNPIRMEGWPQRPQEGARVRVYVGETFAGIGEVQTDSIRFACMLYRGEAEK